MSDRNGQGNAVLDGGADEPFNEETLAAFERWVRQLSTGKVRERALDELRLLRDMLVQNRAPRLALVGRRGAGKSSLINALLGAEVAAVGHTSAETMEPTWRDYVGPSGTLEILDTRGLQEGDRPETGGSAGGRRAGNGKDDVSGDPAVLQLMEAFAAKPPDVVLFAVKAKEADAGINGDLERLAHLARIEQRRIGQPMAVLAVVTQCDELHPKRAPLHAPELDPQGVREKQARVSEVVDLVRARIGALSATTLLGVVPVVSYLEWRGDEIVLDERWNIERLAQMISEELPYTALMEMVRATQVKQLKRRLARRIVQASSAVATGVAVAPLPVGDLLPMAAVQASMVAAIASLSGPVTTKRLGEFGAALGITAGAAYGARELFRTLVQMVPGVGQLIGMGMAYATTQALGAAAIAWFIENERDAKTLRERVKRDVKRYRKEAEAEGLEG